MNTEWIGLAGAVLMAGLAATGVSEEGVPFPDALARSAVTLATLDEPINDALILGNGDLNGLLFAEGEDLVFRITKNDVWDARIDTALDPPLPTLERLKELGQGDWPDRNWILPEGSDWQGPDSYHAHAYPCPRACGVVRLVGAARPPLVAKLDIERARADVYAEAGAARVLVPADANVLVCTTESETKILLESIQSDDLPSPETGKGNECTWISQTIPGDADWPGMTFAVACATRVGRAAVAVVTSRESDNPLEAALALAKATLGRDAEALERAHGDVWAKFWSRSGIELADEVLERTWYRNLYFLRCVSKPGVVSTGLFAGLLDDKPAWHGDYHTNYNIQQTYWAAYSANHCDLAEPYDRLITNYLPRARWQAKEIFDCDGAFFPHVLYAYEPSDPAQCASPNGRQYIHHVWGFTLGVTGFTVQPLWWRYKYAPDRTYLEQVAYPAVRDTAIFYAEFVDRCERDGNTIVLAPTVSPEHHGWTADFARNRDGAFCIAYFHAIFDAAIEGAATLGRDADLVGRWRGAKALLPDYPQFEAPYGEVVVDVAGAAPMTYNIPVPTTPVFPADQVTRDAPADVQTLFRRTLDNLEHNGNNAPVMLAVARARLGTPDAHDWLRTELERRERRNGTLSFNRLDPRFRFNDFGHYTEMFGAALPITELLLQSVGDVVRVFPAWPTWLPARFERLRAQGGFLVTASYGDGQVTELHIESTVGGELRLEGPFPAAEIRCADDAPWEPAPSDDQGRLCVETAPGQVLTLRAKAVWERVRAQGRLNTFRRKGEASIMRIRGDKGVSTGYRMAGLDVPAVSAVTAELEGSPNAQYFVEVHTVAGQVVSEWRPSPTAVAETTLDCPARATVTAVVLYTMTTDGQDAWNAFHAVGLTTPAGETSLDLEALK